MDKQFFNNEVKELYFDSLKSDKSLETIRFLFGRLTETEELLGKDMYEFDFRDFVMMFDRNKISAASTFTTDKSIIRNYIKWCTLNNYCEDTLSELDRMNLSDVNAALKIRTEMFMNEDELFDCINEIFSDYDQSFRDIYLAFYGLFWYGLINSEIYILEASAFSDNSLAVSGEVLKLSDRYSEILRRYLSEGEVLMHIGGMEKKYSFFPTELLIKNIKISNADKTIDANYHTQRRKKWDKVMNETGVNARFYGKKLVPTAIRNSGNFYRAYLDEQNGKTIENNNICNYFREFTSAAEKKKVTSMIKFCKFRDYTAWKKIFYE